MCNTAKPNLVGAVSAQKRESFKLKLATYVGDLVSVLS